jgi:hypothetical protein
MRRVFVIALVATLTAASVDLGACGDKFLRVGRSARFRRYAAVHPATILIYPPQNSTHRGIEELNALLKQAGHRPVAIEREAGIVGILAAARYDVVIADYADAAQIKASLEAAPSKPELLPILDNPTQTVESEAEKQYACLLKPHAMTKFDALVEIDRLMELKLSGGPAHHAK